MGQKDAFQTSGNSPTKSSAYEHIRRAFANLHDRLAAEFLTTTTTKPVEKASRSAIVGADEPAPEPTAPIEPEYTPGQAELFLRKAVLLARMAERSPHVYRSQVHRRLSQKCYDLGDIDGPNVDVEELIRQAVRSLEPEPKPQPKPRRKVF